MPALFESPRFVVRELRPDEIPHLQVLFEANPDYFVTVSGQPPDANEAQREFDELPPSHLSYNTRWFAGVFDRNGKLSGLIILVSDLCTRGVWHMALFFLEGPLRGIGAARELHTALESYALASGAKWLRLGVIEGNIPAERFWAKCGYKELRTRPLTNASGQSKTSKVMVKPLAGGELSAYLRLVPRDEPNSLLP